MRRPAPLLAALSVLVTGALLAADATATVARAHPASAPGKPDTRPNVLLIKTDDQVMERLSSLSATMPFLAGYFAEQGREFTRSYVSSPSCCQSRASTFVGRYPHNEGVWSQGAGASLDSRGTIGTYLQKAGYRTGLVGKYLNLVDHDLPGYDWWTTLRGDCAGATQTEDCTGNAPVWYYNFEVASNEPSDRAPEFVVAGDSSTGDGYNTTWSGARLRRYLARAVAEPGPWYLEWDPTAPHVHDTLADMVEPAHAGAAVPGCDPPIEPDRTDKPAFVQAWTDDDRRFGANAICPAAQRTLLSVDDQFAKIIDLLGRSGELADTMIIFTSDNGLMNGEHDLRRKFVAYEPSVRVPLLVSWPGHVVPGVDRRLVSNIDLLPTVLEATQTLPDPGLPKPDGQSLLSGAGHRLILSEYRRDPGWAAAKPAPFPTWASVTDGHYKYVELFSDIPGKYLQFREYYDLDRDPGELFNLLGDTDTGNDPDVAVLHQRLAALRACKGVRGPAACP